MATAVAHASSVIMALAAPVARMRGAGPQDPVQDFGSLWGFAVALNVINTLIVLYFLVKMWRQKEGPAPLK
ncbi:MAG TPA: hypothetical protein VEP50_18290 [bacterium]|nr:hypothetical protein [bacterium]